MSNADNNPNPPPAVRGEIVRVLHAVASLANGAARKINSTGYGLEAALDRLGPAISTAILLIVRDRLVAERQSCNTDCLNSQKAAEEAISYIYRILARASMRN